MRTNTRLFLKAAAILVVINAFHHTPDIASASDILIIANKKVETNALTKAEIRNIFLGITTFWPDNNKITFVTTEEHEVHKEFVKIYVNKRVDQFNAYWRHQLFMGKGMLPKSFNTEQEIVNFVTQTDGAIGYVSSSASINNVKVITVSDN